MLHNEYQSYHHHEIPAVKVTRKDTVNHCEIMMCDSFLVISARKYLPSGDIVQLCHPGKKSTHLSLILYTLRLTPKECTTPKKASRCSWLLLFPGLL